MYYKFYHSSYFILIISFEKFKKTLMYTRSHPFCGNVLYIYKGKMIPLQARCGPEGGRGIALLFHDRGTIRGWVVSSTPRPHFSPGKVPIPIIQEAGRAPGQVWTGGKSRPHRDSILDRPARSQSLYRLSYRAHTKLCMLLYIQPEDGFYVSKHVAVNCLKW